MLAVRALGRMYRRQEGLFGFCLRRHQDHSGIRVELEGISYRYTAIVLLALADESPEAADEALQGDSAEAVCSRLVDHAGRTEDPGEVALALWAARRMNHPQAGQALKRLVQVAPDRRSIPTVEMSWALSALSAQSPVATDVGLANRIADRLMSSQDRRTGLFPHGTPGSPTPWLRGHICCFADMVYPVQALSYYYRLTDKALVRDAAIACGQRMCNLQGEEGQWWWHHDVCTGRVVERYPVYAVHQDGMGPMAVFDLQEACGGDYRAAVIKSVEWLVHSPEINGSLIDHEAGVIWRKVFRREPGKLVRGIQAMASRLHPSLRMPLADTFFPPIAVDYESRPYHMGWLLFAWSGCRVRQLVGITS